MQVGDLVEFRGFRGLVLKIDTPCGTAYVAWFGIEAEWDSVTLLEVISASR